MIHDLPDWLDDIVCGSLRDALIDARHARARAVRDGAATRAAKMFGAGETLLLEAERLIEHGEPGVVAARKVRSARNRYDRARHDALDISDGKCPKCRARLAPVDDERSFGSNGYGVVVRSVALRCGPCSTTYSDVIVSPMFREDGVVEVLVDRRNTAWRDQPDRERDDDGERLTVEDTL